MLLNQEIGNHSTNPEKNNGKCDCHACALCVESPRHPSLRVVGYAIGISVSNFLIAYVCTTGELCLSVRKSDAIVAKCGTYSGSGRPEGSHHVLDIHRGRASGKGSTSGGTSPFTVLSSECRPVFPPAAFTETSL